MQYLRGYELDVQSADVSTGENVITRANLHDPATVGLYDAEAQRQRTIVTPPLKKRAP